MAAILGDRVFDNGLTTLDTEGDRFYITSAQAATFAEATTTYALGYKALAAVDVSAPADRTGGGREVTVAQLAGGSVTADGTATHWAIVDFANSRFLASNNLSASQAVVNGNTFSTTATHKIGIPDPA